MDTCAHHVGPREYGPFPTIEHRQLFTQPPRSPILRSSWAIIPRNVYANWPIWGCAVPTRSVRCPSHSGARRNNATGCRGRDPDRTRSGPPEGGRSPKAPVKAIAYALNYALKSKLPLFTEVPRRGILGTSRRSTGSGIMLVVEKARTRLHTQSGIGKEQALGCSTS